MASLITRATRVVDLCLNMNLQGDWEHAERALVDAKNEAAQDAREASTAVREAALRVQELEQEMRAHTILFTLQALPRKKWAEFVAEHPPVEGDAIDKTFGVHIGDLDEVITGSGDRPSAVIAVTTRDGQPFEFDVATQWNELADEMTNPQWEKFALALIDLNQTGGGTSVPFSPAASLAILRSEPTSKRPSGSGSRTSGSQAGSRAHATSTTKKGA